MVSESDKLERLLTTVPDNCADLCMNTQVAESGQAVVKGLGWKVQRTVDGAALCTKA